MMLESFEEWQELVGELPVLSDASFSLWLPLLSVSPPPPPPQAVTRSTKNSAVRPLHETPVRSVIIEPSFPLEKTWAQLPPRPALRHPTALSKIGIATQVAWSGAKCSVKSHPALQHRQKKNVIQRGAKRSRRIQHPLFPTRAERRNKERNNPSRISPVRFSGRCSVMDAATARSMTSRGEDLRSSLSIQKRCHPARSEAKSQDPSPAVSNSRGTP